ncbi:MAG: hypothetical protein NZ602_09120 [Thermoguttaceae bacterium]|nr:hypothetical protein [Thermoguttaceae bacterium]MDW8039377.1 hypothetical protein [Thermoguttaceae bacterium]
MTSAKWFCKFCLVSWVALLAVIFLGGGCGAEPPKPKSETSQASASLEPLAKPLTPQPISAEGKTQPEEKRLDAPQTKPSPPEIPSQPPKQEPTSPPAAEKPPSPAPLAKNAPVSSYAPAEDLEAQMELYLEELQKAVQNEEAFKDIEGRLAEDGNTLIILALALGLHDQPNKYQKAAPALMAAAKELASAKDFSSAKKAVQALVSAVSSQGDPSSLKWEKVASLPPLMKAVPLISTKITDSALKPARLEKRGKLYAGYAALLGVIAQGALPNADETEKPNEVEKWEQFCLQMRAAAGELNAAIRAKNSEAALKANAKLRQSCDDCHAVFHTKQVAPQQ